MREPTVETEQPASAPGHSLPDAMRIAAARRSRGENWPEICETLARPEPEVCRWPIWMADEWTPIYARAEADAVERAAALALVRLVDVVQNFNERNSIEAARTILVHRRQLLRIEQLETADERGLTPITASGCDSEPTQTGERRPSAFICGSEDLELLNAAREASALALAKLVELLECGDEALALGAARAILLYRRQLLRWTYSPRPRGYPVPLVPRTTEGLEAGGVGSDRGSLTISRREPWSAPTRSPVSELTTHAKAGVAVEPGPEFADVRPDSAKKEPAGGVEDDPGQDDDLSPRAIVNPDTGSAKSADRPAPEHPP